MINIERQITHWYETAFSDLETAEILFEKGKIIQSLFFCHLSIEKMLKALYVKGNQNIPPKSHDLFYIASKTNIKITDNQNELLAMLMKYQLEGRYPDYPLKTPAKHVAVDLLNQTKELYECLIKELKI